MRAKLLVVVLLFTGILTSAICVKGATNREKESTNGTEQYSINEAYKYPILPGTKEWNEYDSTMKRVEACKVPMEILEEMSTEALVETIVTYPYFTNVTAWDTLEMGVEALNEQFGGIKELLTREDAYDCTIGFINAICPDILNLKPEDDWDEFMEVFKEKNKTQFDIIHLINADILLKILNLYNDNNETLRSGVLTYVLTPRTQTHVTATQGYTWIDQGANPGYVNTINSNFYTTFPTAVSVDPINPAYNCHSYAWHSQSTSNDYWIEGNHIYPYFLDLSYLPAGSNTPQRVLYRSSSGSAGHSAVYSYYNTFTQTEYVTSKWGYYGVFYHRLDDCPYYSTNPNITYWVVNP